jgi:hypothetical protein
MNQFIATQMGLDNPLSRDEHALLAIQEGEAS